ncbi:rhodanese-like domain-containing protein [Nocardia sp. NPDC050793]|uniref:rhodanese-like domain-containing protein n=1 Tax=Nocardia sp. NPDC050793 TaxID=3155159 RepID=UPI00340C1FC3
MITTVALTSNHSQALTRNAITHIEYSRRHVGGPIEPLRSPPGARRVGAVTRMVSASFGQLRARASEIPAGPVLVFGRVGHRGDSATRLLTQLGWDAVNLDGGYRTWRIADLS